MGGSRAASSPSCSSSGSAQRRQLFQQRLGPAPAGQVQQQSQRGVGEIGGDDAAEEERGIVLGLQHPAGMAIDLRLVLLDPQQLGRGVGRADAVAGELIDLGLAAALAHHLSLGRSALVGPDDGRPQRRAGRIHQQRAVHVPAEANHGHVRRAVAGLLCCCDQPLCGLEQRRLPIGRVLLGPIRLGVTGIVGGEGRRNHRAISRKQRRLVAGGAQVVGEEEGGHGGGSVKCQVSSVKCQVSGVGCRVSGVGCRVSGVGCQVRERRMPGDTLTLDT